MLLQLATGRGRGYVECETKGKDKEIIKKKRMIKKVRMKEDWKGQLCYFHPVPIRMLSCGSYKLQPFLFFLT